MPRGAVKPCRGPTKGPANLRLKKMVVFSVTGIIKAGHGGCQGHLVGTKGMPWGLSGPPRGHPIACRVGCQGMLWGLSGHPVGTQWHAVWAVKACHGGCRGHPVGTQWYAVWAVKAMPGGTPSPPWQASTLQLKVERGFEGHALGTRFECPVNYSKCLVKFPECLVKFFRVTRPNLRPPWGEHFEWCWEGGGTNRSDTGLNLSGSWQQGHSATYNTPSRI